jgi:hypothetical protein
LKESEAFLKEKKKVPNVKKGQVVKSKKYQKCKKGVIEKII